ncbi:MAG: DUF2087 domain-containing protein [Anaerolineae bacterium]|nr:DUF2087 domain-containing protein [Anaerolineae bacterium]
MILPDALLPLLDDEGRLKQWPSKRSIQLMALDYLAAQFTSGQIYTEREVNAFLDRWHTFGDAALLRRELYERGLLNREKDGSAYWSTPNTKML